MAKNHQPSLIMGATGSVGASIVQKLLDEGRPVRVSSRNPRPDQFPNGVAVFAADVTVPDSLHEAFAGVGQVFLYANHDGVQGVLAAARKAGVERIVLLSSGSVLHATSAGNPITEDHRAIEQAFLAAEDVPVFPIRPLVLATNVLNWAHSIRAEGRVALYCPDALTAPIHERDVAEVAVTALTRGDEWATGLLTGPRRISQREQVAAIGRALGAELEVAELSRAEAGERFARFMPMVEAEAVLRFLDDAAVGNSPATNTVPDVLGRPALDFAVWAADHVNDFR